MPGPPRFVRESHHRFMRGAQLPGVEPTSVLRFRPARAAIVMDHRIWHGGKPNVSHQYPSVWGRGCCGPMLSANYAAPFTMTSKQILFSSTTALRYPRKCGQRCQALCSNCADTWRMRALMQKRSGNGVGCMFQVAPIRSTTLGASRKASRNTEFDA